MNFKKLITSVVFVLGTWMSVGLAMAQTNSGITVPGYGVWDFSTVTGTFTDNSELLQTQPWWGSESTAITFATAGGNFGGSPDFAYSLTSNDTFYNAAYNMGSVTTYSAPINKPTTGFGFAVATASSSGVPEIDGALAPKVGFLLACLFLIFGRKRENTESLMTA